VTVARVVTVTAAVAAAAGAGVGAAHRRIAARLRTSNP